MCNYVAYLLFQIIIESLYASLQRMGNSVAYILLLMPAVLVSA